MNGSRYAAGLVGGLLLGLVIVGGSMVPLFVSPTSQTGGTPQVDTGNGSAKTVTSTTSTGQSAAQAAQNETTANPTPPSTTTTGQSTSQVPTAASNGGMNFASFIFGAQTGAKGGSASSLSTLASQSPGQDLVVILPLVGALVLATILYQSTRKKDEKSSDSD